MTSTFLRLFIMSFLLVCYSCNKHKKIESFPAPTEKTTVRSGGEESDSYLARQKWIDLLHGGSKSDWRSIETSNQMDKYTSSLRADSDTRGDDEWLAGGRLLGKWIERGSNNNAGNIMVVDYDVKEEMIYAVGGGGPMFKGDLSAYNWTLVNDKLRFSTNLLKILYLSNGTKRILSAVNGMPHFSDDEGITWIKSTGVVPTADGWELYDSEVTSDGKIFFIGRKEYNSSIRIYCSFDFGKSFKNLKLFNTSDSRNISLGFNAKNDDGGPRHLSPLHECRESV